MRRTENGRFEKLTLINFLACKLASGGERWEGEEGDDGHVMYRENAAAEISSQHEAPWNVRR